MEKIIDLVIKTVQEVGYDLDNQALIEANKDTLLFGENLDSSDGSIRIMGRSKEVINVGGEKVMPTEIESLVLELDEVKDCIAYGQNNSITGQIVALKVVTKKTVIPKDLKALIRKHCKAQLDNYKIPVKIEFVDKLELSNRFKKKRNKLK